jgi:hypothetical protein
MAYLDSERLTAAFKHIFNVLHTSTTFTSDGEKLESRHPIFSPNLLSEVPGISQDNNLDKRIKRIRTWTSASALADETIVYDTRAKQLEALYSGSFVTTYVSESNGEVKSGERPESEQSASFQYVEKIIIPILSDNTATHPHPDFPDSNQFYLALDWSNVRDGVEASSFDGNFQFKFDATDDTYPFIVAPPGYIQRFSDRLTNWLFKQKLGSDYADTMYASNTNLSGINGDVTILADGQTDDATGNITYYGGKSFNPAGGTIQLGIGNQSSSIPGDAYRADRVDLKDGGGNYLNLPLWIEGYRYIGPTGSAAGAGGSGNTLFVTGSDPEKLPHSMSGNFTMSFDGDSGLNISKSDDDTITVSLGSAFHEFRVGHSASLDHPSGAQAIHATGSDILELHTGSRGLNIWVESQSAVKATGWGKEVHFDLNPIVNLGWDDSAPTIVSQLTASSIRAVTGSFDEFVFSTTTITSTDNQTHFSSSLFSGSTIFGSHDPDSSVPPEQFIHQFTGSIYISGSGEFRIPSISFDYASGSTLQSENISSSGTVFANNFYQGANKAYLVPASISQSLWATQSATNAISRESRVILKSDGTETATLQFDESSGIITGPDGEVSFLHFQAHPNNQILFNKPLRSGDDGEIRFGADTDYKIKHTAYATRLDFTEGSTVRMTLNDENFGINEINPAEKLEVGGNISASGTGSFSELSIGGGTFTSASLAAGGGGGVSSYTALSDIPDGIISGSDHIFTAITSSGDISASGDIYGRHIIPNDVAGVHTLGNVLNKWDRLYMSSEIHHDGHLFFSGSAGDDAIIMTDVNVSLTQTSSKLTVNMSPRTRLNHIAQFTMGGEQVYAIGKGVPFSVTPDGEGHTGNEGFGHQFPPKNDFKENLVLEEPIVTIKNSYPGSAMSGSSTWLECINVLSSSEGVVSHSSFVIGWDGKEVVTGYNTTQPSASIHIVPTGSAVNKDSLRVDSVSGGKLFSVNTSSMKLRYESDATKVTEFRVDSKDNLSINDVLKVNHKEVLFSSGSYDVTASVDPSTGQMKFKSNDGTYVAFKGSEFETLDASGIVRKRRAEGGKEILISGSDETSRIEMHQNATGAHIVLSGSAATLAYVASGSVKTRIDYPGKTFMKDENLNTWSFGLSNTGTFGINDSIAIGIPPRFEFSDTKFESAVDIKTGGQLWAEGSISASGDLFIRNVTASGDLYADDVFVGDKMGVDGAGITSGKSLTVAGDISASGDLYFNDAVAINQDVNISGTLTATRKSFLIPHPTKEDKKLQYASLEGPENGVYVRGVLKGDYRIKLPEYWTKLVDKETITVSLTPIGRFQYLYVKDIRNNEILVGCKKPTRKIYCHYVIYAERKDIDKLKVEI